MKILMFGWEFPPFNSGGLGVACKGIAQALANQGIQVLFVLPKKVDCLPGSLRFIFADQNDCIRIKTIRSFLQPYLTPESYCQSVKRACATPWYNSTLFEEVARYAKSAEKIASRENFDLIHAHDWLSFPAALAAQRVSGKPLVVHIHATEFDRGGGSVNQYIYDIEKEGMTQAQAVIAVSNFTKNKIINHYGINPQKVWIVHNAIDEVDFPPVNQLDGLEKLKRDGKKFVLFVGRLTLQKGPDYFLRAAKKVLEYNNNVRFIIAGSGDMEKQMIEEAAWLGIADKVFFVGFLERGKRLSQLYQLADLYVLPSVSEPFGLTVLEALLHRTPILISKQSGVAEALSHCLKVDFWDTDEMANKILSTLKYSSLQEVLGDNGKQEARKFSWRDSASKCIKIYQNILSK